MFLYKQASSVREDDRSSIEIRSTVVRRGSGTVGVLLELHRLPGVFTSNHEQSINIYFSVIVQCHIHIYTVLSLGKCLLKRFLLHIINTESLS